MEYSSIINFCLVQCSHSGVMYMDGRIILKQGGWGNVSDLNWLII
jgi:hypothetical protein